MSTTEAELFFQTDTSIKTNQLKASKAKNDSGRPIRLGLGLDLGRSQGAVKILDVLAVRSGIGRCEKGYGGKRGCSGLFMAESGGWVREVCLGTTETTAIYTGPTAPLTSLAYSAATSTLYSGCWDTCIWAWKVKDKVKVNGRVEGEEEKRTESREASGNTTAKTPRRIPGYRFTPASSRGHTGFVKSLRLARLASQSHGGKGREGNADRRDPSSGGREILVSGGADGAIYIWDTMNGKRIVSGDDDGKGSGSGGGGGGDKSLKGLDRSVSALAFDPFLSSSSSNSSDGGEYQKKTMSSQPMTLFSAGSGISIRRWAISSSSSTSSSSSSMIQEKEEGEQQNQTSTIQVSPLPPLPPHTHHDSSISALAFDKYGDLWTASADRTVRHLVRDRNWAVDTQLEHPDVVSDVLVLDLDLDVDQDGFGSEHDDGKNEGWIATACRDEEVRVWDGVSGTLLHTFSGHFAPVSALCLANDGGTRDNDSGSSGSSARDTLISVSLDGTIRRWRLDRLREAVRLAEQAEIQSDKVEGEHEHEHEHKRSMRKLKPGTDEWEGEGKDEDEEEKGKGTEDDDGDKKKMKQQKKSTLMTEEEEKELEELMGEDD